MCKEKGNPRNLAGMENRERGTHNGGVLWNGGAHFDPKISAAMVPS